MNRNTYLIWVQRPCGPRANPINHLSKVVAVAPSEEIARAQAIAVVAKQDDRSRYSVSRVDYIDEGAHIIVG